MSTESSKFLNAKKCVNKRMNHLQDRYVRQLAKYLDIPNFDSEDIEVIRDRTENVVAKIKLNKQQKSLRL